MNKYELILLLPIKEELSNIKKILTDYSAIVEEEKDWGEKKLAYKIKNHQKAYYYLFKITFKDKRLLSKFRKELDFNEKIIRYLLLVSSK